MEGLWLFIADEYNIFLSVSQKLEPHIQEGIRQYEILQATVEGFLTTAIFRDLPAISPSLVSYEFDPGSVPWVILVSWCSLLCPRGVEAESQDSWGPVLLIAPLPYPLSKRAKWDYD
jgi:hypothetical protein